MKDFIVDLFTWFYSDFSLLNVEVVNVIVFVTSVLIFVFIGFFFYKNLFKRGKK